MEKKLKFFPGCSLAEGMAVSYHTSNSAVLKKTGAQIEILDEWNCCGSVYLTNYTGGHKASVGLGALNIAKATKENADLVIACSECNRKMLRSRYYLKKDEYLQKEIRNFLEKDDMPLNVDTGIYHLLDYYINNIGFKKIKEHIKFPLNDLKVYPYIGCLYSRPKKYFDEVDSRRDPEKPKELGILMESLGCNVVHANYITECCGASSVLTKEELANDMLKSIFNDVEDTGADVVVTVCPMCHLNLDSRQRYLGMKRRIPVLHFTQLIGLAMDLKQKDLGLNTNITNIAPLMTKIKKLKQEKFESIRIPEELMIKS
jgi:heterodisulfide reductase subunit B